jgi:hypothetical protein
MGRLKAKKRLDKLLMDVHRCREAVKEAKRDRRSRGSAEWALGYVYAKVRFHCEEHGLDLPIDMPAE